MGGELTLQVRQIVCSVLSILNLKYWWDISEGGHQAFENVAGTWEQGQGGNEIWEISAESLEALELEESGEQEELTGSLGVGCVGGCRE